jgi:hypothetical protein
MVMLATIALMVASVMTASTVALATMLFTAGMVMTR